MFVYFITTVQLDYPIIYYIYEVKIREGATSTLSKIVLPQRRYPMFEYWKTVSVNGYPVAVKTFLSRDMFIKATGRTPEEMGAKKLA